MDRARRVRVVFAGVSLSVLIVALVQILDLARKGSEPTRSADAASVRDGMRRVSDPHVSPSRSDADDQGWILEGDEPHPALLYGRVHTTDGAVFEGRLRWAGNREAHWVNAFNGVKLENPWVRYVPPNVRPKERRSFGLFGVDFYRWEREADLDRPFMVPMGNIVTIEARFSRIIVSLKSGSVYTLDRFNADDLADGIRIWDRKRGVVDLAERQIRLVEFDALEAPGNAPQPLRGTVHTADVNFSGLIQWGRDTMLRSDGFTVIPGTEMSGGRVDEPAKDGVSRSAEERSPGRTIPFSAVRSIVRDDAFSLHIALRDRPSILVPAHRFKFHNEEIAVYDPRFGRVRIGWRGWNRVEFDLADSAPAYAEFRVGRPLWGTVSMRSGRRLIGRLVFDLDESETTETLDSTAEGIDYSIPFHLIARIVPSVLGGESAHAEVVLHSGPQLRFEKVGDLGDQNAGVLVFFETTSEDPLHEYVPWSEVGQIDFDALE